MEPCPDPSGEETDPPGERQLEDLVLADTDVIIDYFNGFSPIAEEIESLIRGDRLSTTAVTVFELYAGVVGKKRLEAIEVLLKSVAILPLEPFAAKTAGELFTYLKSKGKLIGNQDLMIAATALSHGLPLFTRNRDHFARIKGLEFYGP